MGAWELEVEWRWGGGRQGGVEWSMVPEVPLLIAGDAAWPARLRAVRPSAVLRHCECC